jgi:hypothetical protein
MNMPDGRLERVVGPYGASKVIAKLIDGPADSAVLWSRSRELLAQSSDELFVLLRTEGARFEFYTPSGTDALLQIINKLVATLPADGLAMSMLTQGLLVLIVESAEQMHEEETAALNRIVVAMGVSALRVVLMANRSFQPELTGPASLTVGKTCHWTLDVERPADPMPVPSLERVEPTLEASFDDLLEPDVHVKRAIQRRPAALMISLALVAGTLIVGWLAYSKGFFGEAMTSVAERQPAGPVYFRCVAPGGVEAVNLLKQKLAAEFPAQIVDGTEGAQLYIGPLQASKDIDLVRARIWSVGACGIATVSAIESAK